MRVEYACPYVCGWPDQNLCLSDSLQEHKYVNFLFTGIWFMRGFSGRIFLCFRMFHHQSNPVVSDENSVVESKKVNHSKISCAFPSGKLCELQNELKTETR